MHKIMFGAAGFCVIAAICAFSIMEKPGVPPDMPIICFGFTVVGLGLFVVGLIIASDSVDDESLL